MQWTPALRGYRGYYKNCARYDRVSGGVCVYVLVTVPSAAVPLHMTIKAVAAVAVKIGTTQELTVCSVYLPLDEVVSLADLSPLVHQLLPPFILWENFNAHHPLWGGTQTSAHSRDVENLFTQLGTFSATDLSVCSPSLTLYLT